MSGRGGAILSRVYLAAIFAFVFAPIVASFVFSFNSDRFPTVPLGSFSACRLLGWKPIAPSAGTRGAPDAAFARQVAMYLAHVESGLNYTEVGRLFARDRTLLRARNLADWRRSECVLIGGGGETRGVRPAYTDPRLWVRNAPTVKTSGYSRS